MAKDFVKLSEVAVKEEVSDNATVLVEENGEIYRAPKTSVGGGAGGIKTAIIRHVQYQNAIAGVMPGELAPIYWECINMTFEEAIATLKSGEPLAAICMAVSNEGMAQCIPGLATFSPSTIGEERIYFEFYSGVQNNPIYIFWASDYLGEEV